MKKLTILGSFLIAAAVLTSCGGNDPAADAKALKNCNCELAKVTEADKIEAAAKKCTDLAKTQTEAYKDDEDGAKEYAAAVLKAMKEDCPE